MNNTSAVYLNGDYLPQNEAKVSVLDRGFIFGDGVYEVIPAYGGRLFRLAQHLERLNNSLTAIRLPNPHTSSDWETILSKIVDQNGTASQDQSVYLQITRGVAQRDHGFPEEVVPTVFAMSNPLTPLTTEILTQGVHAITLDDIRWQHCYIKTIALLPNILLRQQAMDEGAVEAILVKNGEVTEGAASNLFIVKDDTLLTPPKSDQLLPGITRDLVVELAHEHGIPCQETAISESDLHNATEVWLTSSTKEILPVTQLDNQPVGSGKPGSVWQKIYALYQDYKTTLRTNA